MKWSPSIRISRRNALISLLSFAASLPIQSARCQVDQNSLEPPRKNRPIVRHRTLRSTWLTLPPTPTLPRPTWSGLLKINGTVIFVAQFGKGPPVLLLHGGLGNSNYWGHQVKELAQNFTVTVMDSRGHGRSPLTSHKFSYRIFVQDVAELLDTLQIPTVSVVGWSDGAITGLQLAMLHQSRVSKLFAFGANISIDGLKASGSKSPIFLSYVERCKSEYAELSSNPKKWSQLLSGLRPMWRTEPNFTAEQLKSLQCPIAISAGEYDEIIKREHTEHIAHEIEGAQLIIQPNVSHFAMLQNPDQFNRAMVQFLE